MIGIFDYKAKKRWDGNMQGLLPPPRKHSRGQKYSVNSAAGRHSRAF